jgi:hypothetical protein
MGFVLRWVIIRDSLVAWEVDFSWFMAVVDEVFLQFEGFFVHSQQLLICCQFAGFVPIIRGIRSFVCVAMYGIISYAP